MPPFPTVIVWREGEAELVTVLLLLSDGLWAKVSERKVERVRMRRIVKSTREQ